MTFAAKLRAALLDQLGKDWVTFMPKWDQERRGITWRHGGVPDALMLHHTAACNGDKTGANASIIDYIQNHYTVPAANCTLDRDGRVYIHAAYPIFHSGLGSFRGRAPWSALKIPDNVAHDYLAGVEIMSKGLRKDFTVHQQDSLVFLLRAWRDASGWDNIGTLRRPQHRSWAPQRKVDLKYSDSEIGSMITRYGFAAA